MASGFVDIGGSVDHHMVEQNSYKATIFEPIHYTCNILVFPLRSARNEQSLLRYVFVYAVARQQFSTHAIHYILVFPLQSQLPPT